MCMDLPKVLCPVNGIPIINRLLAGVETLFSRPIVVIGYRGGEIMTVLGDTCVYVKQEEQLGTSHAVQCALSACVTDEYDRIIVVPGDHPFVSMETLRQITTLAHETSAPVCLATIALANFDGDFSAFRSFGRIIRNDKREVIGIIEYKDASEEVREIREVNVGYYCFDVAWLRENIGKINNKNASGEYYLTDIVKIAFEQQRMVASLVIENPYEGLGVNDVSQLHVAQSYELRQRENS